MFFKRTKNSGVTQEIRVRRCYGCGAILQDLDPNEVGYVPKEKFDSGEDTLCERCYKLRHYSTYKKTPDFNMDYVAILSDAKAEDALVVYVLNAFCLTGSLLDGIGKYLPDNVLVVVNKRDVLPKAYSDEFLKQYVTMKLKPEGIQPKDILLTSTSKGVNIDQMMEDINKLRNGKNVYFIGAYQVGKSSLINSLLKEFHNSTEKMITTSPYPGTTLDVISIPLDNDSYIYDTPGIYNPKSIVSFIEPEIVKYVIPRTEIRPERYPTKDGQSFLLSNLARIDYVSGPKCDITFYKSNDVTIERCKISKADSTFDSLSRNETLRFRTNKVRSIKDLVKTTFEIWESVPYRIRIVGLGFFDFIGSDQVIDVYAPQGVKLIAEKNEVPHEE